VNRPIPIDLFKIQRIPLTRGVGILEKGSPLAFFIENGFDFQNRKNEEAAKVHRFDFGEMIEWEELDTTNPILQYFSLLHMDGLAAK